MLRGENRTIYIDCTNTVFTGLNTGIQRVVRNIIQRIAHTKQLDGWNIVPVVAVMGNFYKFDTDISSKFHWSKALYLLISKLRNVFNLLFFNKHTKGNWPVDIIRGDWPVDIVDNPPPRYDIHGKIVHFCRKIIPHMFKCAYRLDGVINGDSIILNNQDVLFLADAFWKDSLIKSITNNQHLNYKLFILIYDLFPISHPLYVDTVNVINYTNCLSKLIDRINGIISISHTSLQDIQKHISIHKTGVFFDYFYLGADFYSKGKITGNVRLDLATFFDSGSIFLSVGTIEPRKNYEYLLDAFQCVWAQDKDIRLCIVGRVGWKCDDLIQRIISSPELGKRLMHFVDLNDDELEYCYSRSRAVVFPSKVEGFGLPLVEAMQYGKPVLCSDIPVFREIGKNYPLYFDLREPSSLAELVDGFERVSINRQFTPQKWLSWDESIEDLLTKLVSMANKVSSQKICTEL